MQFFAQDTKSEKAGTFKASIEVDPSVATPTQIHVLMEGQPSASPSSINFTWYPNDFEVELSPEGATSSRDGNTLSIFGDALEAGTLLEIKITPL
mmetsp:Transcript_12969/g.20089  ORF Transcript_12969/g.20089 Transcript_12969/m.20089 type:complete len:95 (+) Transcript_12969:1385-1669(+)